MTAERLQKFRKCHAGASVDGGYGIAQSVVSASNRQAEGPCFESRQFSNLACKWWFAECEATQMVLKPFIEQKCKETNQRNSFTETSVFSVAPACMFTTFLTEQQTLMNGPYSTAKRELLM